MASIRERNGKFNVIYSYTNEKGERKQKWETYETKAEAKRRKNAELFEEAFYEKKNLDPQMHVQQENNNATVADEVDPELLAKVLANPEMRALLNLLAKTMK